MSSHPALRVELIARAVLIDPGHTALTVIPDPATSRASDSVKAMTAAFDVVYAVLCGIVYLTIADAMLTIRPHCCLRMGPTAARDIRNTPRTFTAMTRSHAPSVTASISPRSPPCGAPALLTRMSSRPYRAATP